MIGRRLFRREIRAEVQVAVAELLGVLAVRDATAQVQRELRDQARDELASFMDEEWRRPGGRS